MAVLARALSVILRDEDCWGPFVPFYFLGVDILFEVIPVRPRSGVLSLSAEVELWLQDQVIVELPWHLDPGTEMYFLWWWCWCLRCRPMPISYGTRVCISGTQGSGLGLVCVCVCAHTCMCVCVGETNRSTGLGWQVTAVSLAQGWGRVQYQEALGVVGQSPNSGPPDGGVGYSSSLALRIGGQCHNLLGVGKSYHSTAQWWQDKTMTYNPRGWIQRSPSALPHLCNDKLEPQLEPLGWGTKLQWHSPGTAMSYDPQWAVTEQ